MLRLIRLFVLMCAALSGIASAASFSVSRINFESGKAELTLEAMSTLSSLAVYLAQTPGAEVSMFSYAADNGSDSLNLAQLRAASIRNSLSAAGIKEPRVNLVVNAMEAGGSSADQVELSAAPAASAPDTASATPALPDPETLSAPGTVNKERINTGDTAWMLCATALVLLMTIPGLALFYAGMVRKKNVLATMMQSLAITSLVTVLWWACCYSLSFTPGSSPYLGGYTRVMMDGLVFIKDAGRLSVSHLAPNIPESVYAMYQLTFAIITPALICGAFAERMKFSAMLWFMLLWSVLVYAPVAHWMWEPSGWLAAMGMLDFAGGTVVHVNAGIAALACVIVMGPRLGYGRESMAPHNLGLTITGAALLWVGWFGFNAGSAVAADGRAGMAMLATQLATASAALSWMLVEWILNRKPTVLGMATGAVAGLVTITPASGFVDPTAALIIGALGSVACCLASTKLKRMFGYDDSLDVFGVHCIGGAVGAVLTGVFADKQIGGVEGSLQVQLLGVGATLVYSFVVSWVILKLIDLIMGLRVDQGDEQVGLDVAQHGEQVL